jgi:hypothetical protein
LQAAPVASEDLLVSKISGDGSRVIWATYLAGSGMDHGAGSIRVDSAGQAYVLTMTDSRDLPVHRAVQSAYGGGESDLYLAKLAADGSRLVFGTYLGGSRSEGIETHNLAVDPAGHAYVAAQTDSPDFPTTPGVLQRSLDGTGRAGTGGGTNYAGEGVVAKIAADGGQLLASTYLGGRFGDGVEGVAVDAEGTIYFAGATYSDDFPITADGHQRTNAGNGDLFAGILSADFSHLLYATYLGGADFDYGRTAAVDANGTLYVAGHTGSRDWPVANSLQATYRGGGSDGVFVSLRPAPAEPSATATSGTEDDQTEDDQERAR